MLKTFLATAFLTSLLAAQTVVTPPSAGAISATAGNLSVTITPDGTPATVFTVKLSAGGSAISYTVSLKDAATLTLTKDGNMVGYTFNPVGSGTSVTATSQIGSAAPDPKTVVFR